VILECEAGLRMDEECFGYQAMVHWQIAKIYKM